MSSLWSIIGVSFACFFGTIGFIWVICGSWKVKWFRDLVSSLCPRKCKSLTWRDIRSGRLVHSHKCGNCKKALEHGANMLPVLQHHPLPKCWEATVGEVFSSTTYTRGSITFNETSFPRSLDAPKRYLCVDVEVLLAFIFMVIPDATEEIVIKRLPGKVFDGSIVKLEEEEGNLIAHVKGTHRRYLTFEDCDGLVRSYPPWYRRTVKLNFPGANQEMNHPCFNDSSNVTRAGWVIAVAVTDVEPVPAYLDRPTFVEEIERGKVLLMGCRRTLIVLNRLKEMQIQASNLMAAIAQVELLLDKGPSIGSCVPEPAGQALPANEFCRLARVATEIFDTKPVDRLSTDAVKALETNADLIVYWANHGVHKVLTYSKQPGREIVRDERLRPGRKIYLQDCRLPMN
ncbi:hypothetical protein TrVFT333_001467 [Trichoderma virens FT-333]|nr:hypothetical protein TrVFT333_001467 [Trichoderma virens FT-333]